MIALDVAAPVRRIVREVLPVASAVLPSELRSVVGERLILAAGAQASGYTTRRPMWRTAARGYWLLDVEHVAEVLRFTKGRASLVAAAGALGYRITLMERLELQAALEHNDALGWVVARCLLPPGLEEGVDDAATGWQVYRHVWRPTGPAADSARWLDHYAAAVEALKG